MPCSISPTLVNLNWCTGKGQGVSTDVGGPLTAQGIPNQRLLWFYGPWGGGGGVGSKEQEWLREGKVLSPESERRKESSIFPLLPPPYKETSGGPR